jgi:hypothetical protein
MLKKLIFFLFPILAIAGTNQGSILLLNDSPFILSATIWTTSLDPTSYKHPGTPDVSLTPYTVIWQCSSDEFYSMCSIVSPGALVRANDCQGTRICRPKGKQQRNQPTPASTLKKTK